MRERHNASLFAGVLALALAGGVPAARGGSELEEIRDTQKKILQRLDAQDKVLQTILTRVQSAGGPAQPDPNQVYTIDVGKSPIKGPKTAKVTLVEFSDFQ